MAFHRRHKSTMVDRKYGQWQLPLNGEAQRKMPDCNRREHGRRGKCRAADGQRRKFTALATHIDQPIRKRKRGTKQTKKNETNENFGVFVCFVFFRLFRVSLLLP